MTRHVDGRRVTNWAEVKQPGDYFVIYVDGGTEGTGGPIKAICFSMPGFGQWGRVSSTHDTDAPAEAPKWGITEDADGRVTVNPSIKSWWNEGPEQDERVFHGFLKAGRWEVLGDSIGAVFDDV